MARILIVEDDKANGTFMCDILKKYSSSREYKDWPIKTTLVEDPIRAYQLLKENNYELLITDILMAKMSGWELIREIRKEKPNSDLPILVVSAVDAVDLRYNSARYGASNWLTKPFKPSQFVKTVFDLIGDR